MKYSIFQLQVLQLSKEMSQDEIVNHLNVQLEDKYIKSEITRSSTPIELEVLLFLLILFINVNL